MTRRKGASAAGGLVVAAAVAAVVLSSGNRPAATARTARTPTARVERGELSALVSGTGTLTYRARPDASPFAVVNHADGVYTELPAAGRTVACGGVLYRVDDRPILLLCGKVPVYRALHKGVRGPDARQLNRNLHTTGDVFTARTERALGILQRRRGMRVTEKLAFGAAVFLPERVRIAKVSAALGGSARPGAPVLSATSDELHVRVDLDASSQGAVKRGDRAQITLPGNTPLTGRVTGFGRVAESQPGGQPAAATVPTFIDLDDPASAGGLDQAPVGVDITTKGVQDALSVPITALVGRSAGGYAVEVVGAGERRRLVTVRLGVFDAGGGRVQVRGDLHADDAVVVPSP